MLIAAEVMEDVWLYTRYTALLAPLILGCLQSGFCSPASTPASTLWQLSEQTHGQMMSYVLRTNKGRVIVIDGGRKGEAPYLKAFLKDLGGEVEAWFITHPHSDHHEALAEILDNPDGLKIKRLYASMPDEEWVKAYEPRWIEDIIALKDAMRKAGKCFNEMQPGETLDFDCVRIEVLGIKNPEIHPNALNNSSAVLRVQDPKKSILFLGDLGPEGGEKLMKSRFKNRLRADYVQMAHHGQNGVTQELYKLVQPSCCLWPTPKWLWDNDTGAGKGSGPWKTLEVRQWMEDLKVKRNIVTSIDGLAKIE